MYTEQLLYSHQNLIAMNLKLKISTLFLLLFISLGELSAQNKDRKLKLPMAILKAEKFNKLNSPAKNQTRKTTSQDRRIKTGVYMYKYDTGSGFYTNYDSTIYTNNVGAYSEFSPFDYSYYYYSYTPYEQNFYPLFILESFAAKSSISYSADASRVYSLSDSTSYKYNSSGKLSEVYQQRSNGYSLETFTYDASGRAISERYIYENIGSGPPDTSYYVYRYGTGYIVGQDADGGDTDSARIDASGRTLEYYYGNVLDSKYTYDTNGKLATIKIYDGGVIESSITLNYNSTYNRYSYENIDLNTSGSVVEKSVLTFRDKAGKLDSEIVEVFDASGVLQSVDKTDIEIDNYGNMVKSETYNDTGDLIEFYHYTYEDVELDSKEPLLSFTKLTVFPNPTSNDILRVSASEEFSSIQIYNLSGQIIQRSDFRPRTETELSLTGLSSGSYILTVLSADGRTGTQAFVKK